MMLWLLIGWPASLVIAAGAGARLKDRSPEAQRAEDGEQAAFLREWQERRDAYRKAEARGDTRAMHQRWPALHDATNAKLRAGR